ncbi:MAG: helix-turn-helix domain-containing protein [Deltaproteobacteria bacterium]|nr:helix-turn-helix domain-containing protein [Deltaproteobacteria bacterium]
MIRQQTLADKFGCSRRSIYRALKQLKEQGYLVETKKREKRCKVYQLKAVIPAKAGIQKISEPMLDASLRWHDKMELDPGLRQGDNVPLIEMPRLAKFYLDNCREVFKYNFPESFDWEKFFPEATHQIRHIEHQTKFWRLMFDNLYLIQERETGLPSSARISNEDSTLFGIPYPNKPPATQIDIILRTRPAYRPYRPKSKR